MKSSLAILSIFFGILPVFAEDAGVMDDPTASYTKVYLENVAAVCDSAAFKPKKSLIRQASFPYPEIGDPNSEKRYRDMVKGVGGDASGLQELYSPDIPQTSNALESIIPLKVRNDLSAASEAYKERTNALFACAQIGFKIRTHESIIQTIRGEKADTGNMVKQLETQTRMLRQEGEKRKCTDVSSISDGKGLFLKKILLDNAFYQYCDYRHYLQYLKTNISTRVSKFSKDQKENPDQEGSFSTEKAVTDILQSSSKIDAEIAHTREVFGQAMVAYTEFERTYASHVVLLFITEDYRLLRESLKKIMNPLGQVIYKTSNAQSPYSR